MINYPIPLLTLIASLRKLPGVGKKTAERFAFQMIDWQEDSLESFGDIVKTIKQKLHTCKECGCLMSDTHCLFCDLGNRSSKALCIIASPKDVYAMEETSVFKGIYHVLGTLLSPLEGITPDKLAIEKIQNRIDKHQIQEVIIALDSTLEGDATALYLNKMLSNATISRLALGLPIGSPLDFIDEGTLSQAFTGRQNF